MNSFILVCMDGMTAAGEPASAFVVAGWRMSARRWPIFNRTRHRDEIGPGDRVLIYVGGRRDHAQCFVGTADVVASEPVDHSWRRRSTEFEDGAGDQDTVAWLRLDNVQAIIPALSIRRVLNRLSFLPNNKTRWGTSLMGGVRRIPDGDWDVILSESLTKSR
jgi:EVE domain